MTNAAKLIDVQVAAVLLASLPLTACAAPAEDQNIQNGRGGIQDNTGSMQDIIQDGRA